ncbi:nucleoside triphosphatase nudI domain protein [Kosakonia radicincitans YD4]|nr:nucleoside triphosphatase nudI domain protein [Kosakonia radicincitans YD4]
MPQCAFRDDTRMKTYPDGTKEQIYMIYLNFDCISANREVSINDEFQDFAWVMPADLHRYNLNDTTRRTFTLKGLL